VGVPRASLAARLGAALALLLCAALCGCGSSGSHPRARVLGAGGLAGQAPPGVAASGPARSRPGARPKRPNVVFVLTDDLAWNLVRFMPHVLAMERHGETFANYFVTDSLCCPSRASILTGRFPHDTLVTSNSPPWGGDAVFQARGEELHTFATALRRVGYRTALMGKYLNGYQPRGEAEAGPVGDGVGPLAGRVGAAAGEGFGKPGVPPGWSEWDVAGNGYPEYGYTLNSDGRPVDYGFAPQEYLTEVLARKGLAFIASAARRHNPFLLEIATFAPHSPFVPAPRDLSAFPGLKAPRTPAFDAATVGAPAWLSHFTPLQPAQVELIDRQFRQRAQAVQSVDRMIGAIESELAARGLARDTYIVFSSDNGLHMGEHRLMPGKQTPYDTDIRVPLIVTGPGVPAGRSVGALAENTDLCPTFERLAGAPVGADVDGHSLTALLHGRPVHNWRREILVEHHGPDISADDPDLPTSGAGNPSSYEALRTAASLYVEYVTGELEYYDLRRDPFELHNLAFHLSPARLRQLHRTLLRMELCRGARSCWLAEHGST
jgi:arylsulfatase A-like enzyme